ncbi:hypothetical protein EV702DRAFT_1209359 [Suillus placidus]|uniref:Uncharacterized protein n=1 Tax=Suillus placidus TaxID=48579 RepID=A0A9P7A7E9_9AGAM|nr:hypothetical protein EV702DRAFT_1209359 [Suillus placidus]
MAAKSKQIMGSILNTEEFKRWQAKIFDLFGAPPRSIRKPPKPRKLKPGCDITPSSFRPRVLARDRLHHWMAPVSDSFHYALVKDFPISDVIQLFNVLLISVETKTHENYVTNWLSGLHFWHNLHGAPWHGKLTPESSKRPCRPPVTLEHMHALFCCLDLSNAFDASVFTVASIAFWSCCRLAELIINSVNSFDPMQHVACSIKITRVSPSNSVSWSSFPAPWLKTTLGAGAKIIMSRVDDFTNPVSALNHHISANSSRRMGPMTHPWFLAHCNQVWREAGLLELTGHCFRIGGAHLLSLMLVCQYDRFGRSHHHSLLIYSFVI